MLGSCSRRSVDTSNMSEEAIRLRMTWLSNHISDITAIWYIRGTVAIFNSNKFKRLNLVFLFFNLNYYDTYSKQIFRGYSSTRFRLFLMQQKIIMTLSVINFWTSSYFDSYIVRLRRQSVRVGYEYRLQRLSVHSTCVSLENACSIRWNR